MWHLVQDFIDKDKIEISDLCILKIPFNNINNPWRGKDNEGRRNIYKT